MVKHQKNLKIQTKKNKKIKHITSSIYKSKLFATVAGNHDYWSVGTPILASESDQFGNGHMQFYGMDSIASKNNNVQFLNFSVNPD